MYMQLIVTRMVYGTVKFTYLRKSIIIILLIEMVS